MNKIPIVIPTTSFIGTKLTSMAAMINYRLLKGYHLLGCHAAFASCVKRNCDFYLCGFAPLREPPVLCEFANYAPAKAQSRKVQSPVMAVCLKT
jgi:hypothetical protein